ncbi:DUF4153 domain-containing protein [Duganella violaceipulchra]|uniref:DUF4153 domain-containing protein n=1 Tax=Duganella violaceipulchra TaxID=2849652 RepID=A0AA41HAH4_9BURK|nr:DUF4153 domain-containing protein [Duganella violaceicalia]MBV6323684.1 DUF4153 domain-containing protein [Duganella violaceicalia]MCP2009038.1 hypothetical protein [Duganella violaceicalia]
MEQDETTMEVDVSRQVMALRLATGLAQGALLYWLYRADRGGWWPAGSPYVMTPLLMACSLLPAMLISAMGHMAPKKVAQWMAAAAGVVLIMALHAVSREAGVVRSVGELGKGAFTSMSGPMMIFGAVFMYIAHSLVMAGAADKRRIASYDTYFELAWKLAVQLMFSAFFVGALWLVLLMGSGLFSMVKLGFLKQMMEESWFVVPVICFAWSCAMHITDVRPAIVRGIRSLLLVLLSWILPVAALIISGFLCALPFTGLDVLWATRHATSLLLAADAVLIVLINAAFQNGHAKAALAVRVSARVASLLILPLTAIAIYALGLRVYDYGWTSGRVIAAACLVVASCYALGYAWAAHRYETWLCPIANVNVAAAFVVLAVLLALFTPIADPARLSVNNQMARLEKGRTKAAQFDYHYLRFEGQRYGHEALTRLSQQTTGPDAALIRELAGKALKETNRWQAGSQLAAVSITDNVKVWPATTRLPATFAAQKWSPIEDAAVLPCLLIRGGSCDALVLDVDGDGKPEVLLFNAGRYSAAPLYAERADGKWVVAGHLDASGSECAPLIEKLKAGQYTLVAPRMKALEVAGQLLQFQSEFGAEDCKLIKAAK